MRAMVCRLGFLAAVILVAGSASAADEATIINRPAEKYAIAPGGVDMRTGQYVYSQTDLSIGPDNGGLALTRMAPDYVDGHANPFGNFSHNWDMMLVEKRVGLNNPSEVGTDYRMLLHLGGRTFVFESLETSGGYNYKSDGPDAFLTFASGTKSSSTVVYTLQAPDGTLYLFRPMGNKDCTTTRRCAFVSQITQPDGTILTFDYAYDSLASGNRARLTRVTSSRGYVLMLEGTGSKVTKSCVINSATAVPPSGATCPGTALATASYAYNGGNQLTSVTAADNSVSQFTYGSGTMGFIKPGFATPWLTNDIVTKNDEDDVPHEITTAQSFADGRTYTYQYNYSPATTNKPIPTIAGGAVIDGHSHQINYNYEWPILPGSRQRICRSLPCSPPSPEDEFKYTYQQTSGPVLVSDELGRETVADYCDPVVKAGLPVGELDRCAVTRMQSFTDPEGAKTTFKYDGVGNVMETTRYPKPGSSLTPIVTSAQYALGSVKTQTKPQWRKDGNGNQTDYTYDSAHGGVLTETGPAVNGVRPQKRYSYTQRYAWLKTASSYAQAATPIWLLTGESFCKTSAWTGSACGAGATDEVVTAYDYGPNSGPNNLLLRGTTVTADGITRRTCFTYDSMGRKVSETTPNANLASCP